MCFPFVNTESTRKSSAGVSDKAAFENLTHCLGIASVSIDLLGERVRSRPSVTNALMGVYERTIRSVCGLMRAVLVVRTWALRFRRLCTCVVFGVPGLLSHEHCQQHSMLSSGTQKTPELRVLAYNAWVKVMENFAAAPHVLVCA